MNNNNNNNINMTDAEMEAQFIERNGNLKKSLNNIVDKLDNASTKTQDFLTQNVGNETTTMSTVGTAAPQSSNILEQTNTSGTTAADFGRNAMDAKLMSSIRSDIAAMHSTDAEQFEDVATKMDETFGHNALI